MDLFIDTNIFVTDPFWKGNFAKTLLKHAKSHKINLYLSEIVYQELRIHTIRNNKKSQKELYATVSEYNRYSPVAIPHTPLADISGDFDIFYRSLQDEYGLKILGYNTVSFEKVMDRVLKREKPFNDDKTEVKDCGIWLTYAQFIKDKRLNDCYLLTNNSKDFYEKSPVSTDPTEYRVHDDLKRDTTKFRCFPSIKDFFRLVLEPQIKASLKFQEWLDNTDIDEVFVSKLLRNEQKENIETRISSIVEGLELNNVYADYEWYLIGECQVNDIDWHDCQDIEKDVLEDSCIISALLTFDVSVEGYAYNPSHDDEDSKYYSLGEKHMDVLFHISFILKEGGKLESFEITDINWIT